MEDQIERDRLVSNTHHGWTPVKWVAFKLTELELEIGFIDSNLHWKLPGLNCPASLCSFCRTKQRSVLIHTFTIFRNDMNWKIQTIRVELSINLKMEGNDTNCMVNKKKPAEESWKILQKEISHSHHITRSRTAKQRKRERTSMLHLHLPPRLHKWAVRLSSDHNSIWVSKS